MPRTIPPIRPQAPDSWPSILTVASEGGLADAYTADPTSGWQVGVQALDLEGLAYFEWPPDGAVPDGITPRDSGADSYITEKPAAEHPDTVKFWPWTFGVAIGCGPDSQTPPGETYEAWAEQALVANTARAVSRELWTGYVSQGHCLTRDAVDLTAGVSVKLAIGLGLIQEAVDGYGTWHVPVRAEAAMRSDGLVTDQGLVPRGPGGWPISFGPSYLGDTGPVTSPWRPDTRLASGGTEHSSPDAGAGQCWIIGHAGRIEVAVRDVPAALYGGSGYHHALSNTSEAMKERRAIYRYSPGRVFAVLVRLDDEAS